MARAAGPPPKAKASARPVLLSGGNPQIAKADGETPVRAYIAAMPGWKRAVGERIDAVVTRAAPGAQKAVKWNSPFYGMPGQGWFLSFHCFTRYVKLTFFRGAALKPPPPGLSKQAEVRYLDIHEADEIDEAQLAAWVKQAAKAPGWGASEDKAAKKAPDKKTSAAQAGQADAAAAKLIDARIRELGDWRGDTLARVRKLIHEADPDIVETWKWRGVPVWEHDGIVCTGETYRAFVKLTFARGAALPDPARLFNASLEGNVRRAIDIGEDETLNEAALKALIKAAVALNQAKRK